MSRARCLVADDHPALVAAVAEYVAEHGFDVVGCAADADATVELARRERPALALLDYRMPGCGGAELVRRVKAAARETRIVVYTAEADEQLVGEALGAGADAIVLKDSPLADLVRALQAVLLGRPYVDPGLAHLALDRHGGRSVPTARELEVLELLAEGLSHDEIGRRLAIGSETVRTHARKAADRLGARTRTQAVATAIRLELI